MNDRAQKILALTSLLLCLSAAVYLRVWSISEQVVQGDELYTLEAAVEHDAWYVVSHHHEQSYSIPLALWNRLLIHTTGLGEWGMRLPLLLAGLAMVPLLLVYAWRRFGLPVGLAAAWLAALSPVLLLYSRFARPYMGVVLLSLVTLWLWEKWIRKHRLRYGLPAAIAGALAVYLHFLAAPAIFGLWALGLCWDIRNARKPGHQRDWLPTLGMTAVGAGFLLLLILPGWSQLTQFARAKQGGELPSLEAWWDTAHFLLGTRTNGILIWLLITLTLGAVRSARLKPRLSGLFLAMFLSQIVAVLLLGPHFTIWYYVLGRYLLATIPLILLVAALGLEAHALGLCRILRVDEQSVSGKALRIVIPPVLLIAATLVGPLPMIYRSHNAFTSHPDYYAPPLPRLLPERVPSFYRFLAEIPDDLVVGETPHTRGWFRTSQGFYQNLHRKEIKVITDQEVFRSPGLQFESLVIPREDGCSSEAMDYVIVHKRFQEEISFVNPVPHVRRDLHEIRESSGKARRLRKRSETMQTLCRKDAQLTPIHEDDWLDVFARGQENVRRFQEWQSREP